MCHSKRWHKSLNLQFQVDYVLTSDRCPRADLEDPDKLAPTPEIPFCSTNEGFFFS